MSVVCLYFQVHQPFRLRRYSVFDTTADYFDEEGNERILRKVAEKCYLPANKVLLGLCQKYKGKFRVGVSLSGVVMEGFKRWVPEVLEGFKALAETGCVEFLGETFYHSLSYLYSKEEFREQVERQGEMVEREFGERPRVFRNTELIFDDEVARLAAGMGFEGVLTEGWETVKGSKGAGWVYRMKGGKVKEGSKGGKSSKEKKEGTSGEGLRILLRNYELSDDITFRFGRRDWEGWLLTGEKFAKRIGEVSEGGGGPLCNLFMDYETFGEHQWAEGGIFKFLEEMPGAVMGAGQTFATPGEVVDMGGKAESPPSRKQKAERGGTGGKKKLADGAGFDGGVIEVPETISWADEARDLSAWRGNAMQATALEELYRLEGAVKKKAGKEPGVLEDWRRLTTSDHFYYMLTKHYADGDVHTYFSPYESPYDAYINFMNVLDNLRARLRR